MDLSNMTKKIDIPIQLLKIEAMLEVSLKLQAQIISNQEGKDFNQFVKILFANVDETQKELFQNLPDINK
jgi:hypothetical protein